MHADVALAPDPNREESELRSYLGDDFRPERLQHVGHADAFHLTPVAYLYNLTALAMTGTKLPYLRELVSCVTPGARLLDYGCGIGSDGLLLIEAGYRVEFADFDNPSVEYLRWRLKERGLDAPIHDLEQSVPGGFDAAYALYVIEHAPDPFAFLRELEQRADLVVVSFVEPGPGDHDLHHALPIRDLLAYVADHGLRRHALLDRRVHLVLYQPRRAR